MVNVVWTKRALKQLLGIDSRFRKTIVEKTKQLVAFPVTPLDVKKLKGDANVYRLRIGDYRVIFELVKGEPVVLMIQQIKRRTSHTY